MHVDSFTDEQMLNLVNSVISTETEFKPKDFTGGAVIITTSHKNKIKRFRISLYFGYKGKHPINRQIDIGEEEYFIWAKAIMVKIYSLDVETVGMGMNELNRRMNLKNEQVDSKIVDSMAVDSMVYGTTPCGTTGPLVKEEKILTKTMEQAMSSAEYLSTNLQSSMDKFKQPSESKISGWAKEIEKLIRLDSTTPEEIVTIIDWIHKGGGSFWITNIQSGKKLREKFPKLWTDYTQDAPKATSAKNRILSEVGLGKVFFEYPDKDLNAKVSVCLYGEYNALYDFYRNKYVDKDKAVKVWAYIDEHVNSILIKYRSKQS